MLSIELKQKLNKYIEENYSIEDLGINCLEDSVHGVKPKNRFKNKSKIAMCDLCMSVPMDMGPTFQEKLFELIDSSGLSDVEVYKRSEIDRRLFSKIRSDKNYTPSKNTVIQFIFGLKLDEDIALDLLQIAGYSLSFSIKSDVIIRYFLHERNYNLLELNDALLEYDLKPILQV